GFYESIMNEDKQTDPKPIIEATAISKTYAHRDKVTHALRDVTLLIAKQDIYGIIGLSGAGKSTLIRCLARLITPSSGKVLFHDANINNLKGENLRSFRQRIGMIFQHFNLLSS